MSKTIQNIKAGGVSFSLNKKKDTVKVQIGGETRYVKQVDLWNVAFAMTEDDEMRDRLMPVRKEPMMRFKKVHQVQVKNDMKAGETLTFTSVIDVPTYVVQGLRDLVAREAPEAVEILDRMVKQGEAQKGVHELSPAAPVQRN